MTEQVTHLNTAIVEKFLYALRDKDFDTMESMLADDAVYENYGYTRARGNHRDRLLPGALVLDDGEPALRADRRRLRRAGMSRRQDDQALGALLHGNLNWRVAGDRAVG